jgi:hypothetical protein
VAELRGHGEVFLDDCRVHVELPRIDVIFNEKPGVVRIVVGGLEVDLLQSFHV